MSNPPHSHGNDSADAPSPTATGQAALVWAVSEGRGDEVMRQVAAQVRRNRQKRLGFAGASLAAVLAVGTLWQARHPATDAQPIMPASAVVTKPETQVLPDGSVVELNRGAHITAAFGAGERGVRRVVLDRGEAHFQVTKNPLRPFIVVAGGVEVRAVGTAFSVQLGAQSVEVLVTEGRVAVDQPVSTGSLPPTGTTAPTATPEPLAFLNAGHRVQVDLTSPLSAVALPPPVVAVTEAELRDHLAWRVPLLEFSGTPLAEVIPMFNRHNAGRPRAQLALADGPLGELQVSGVLRADNIPALLRLLQTEFGIVAEPRGDTTVLRRK